MIWLKSKRYTSEYFTDRLAEIIHNARCSTRCMALVAGSAISILFVTQMSCIYGL